MSEKENNEKIQDTDDQELERIHRVLFDHPDIKVWNATRSLAQPSFLDQIDSYSAAYSKPLE
ncbi:MAG: hypothetical protein OXN23_01045 [Gammaproteobacteria bacterium]|nr:hypothetical protein [Gammaproteobacteria bacterium]MDE0302457.1 hypothetical protein [Gammaproteobacteria bacterium]MDE0611908.1 hypothetical protein [Gammaproteobacteria bacterium]